MLLTSDTHNLTVTLMELLCTCDSLQTPALYICFVIDSHDKTGELALYRALEHRKYAHTHPNLDEFRPDFVEM